MNITDLKVLRYIKSHSRKYAVRSSALSHKFGKASEISLKNLENSGYIECPTFNDDCQFGFSSGDNWNITVNGLYYLSNYKAEQKLTSRERLFNYFLGFGSGILTGIIVQLFIRLL